MPLYPFGTVVEIVESVSSFDPSIPAMSVSFPHDDLVFLNHNAFLLQFSKKTDEVLIHINQDAEIEKIDHMITALKGAAQEKEMLFLDGGFYALKQADKENISIEFLPAD